MTKEILMKELPLIGNKGVAEKYNLHVATIHKYKKKFGIGKIKRVCSPRKDYNLEIGKTYNNKTVLDYLGKEINLPKVKVECNNCKQSYDCFLNSLKNPKKVTDYCNNCKPDNRDYSQNLLSNTGLHVSTIYSSYKTRAKRKNIAFEFTKKDVENLVFQNCYYCGNPPDLIRTGGIYNSKTKRKGNYSTYTNGIDRKDSKKGYTLQNSVPCCNTCNIMKNTLNEENFLKMIKTIYEHSVR